LKEPSREWNLIKKVTCGLVHQLHSYI
jgi:hypothetical protein